MIFPATNTTIAEDNSTTLGTDTFVFDFLKRELEIIDGKLIVCNSKEHIQQFIQVVLHTPRNKYKVYTTDTETEFGLSIYNAIGSKVGNTGFYYSECKREIIEQLTAIDEITTINNFKFVNENTKLQIYFDVYYTIADTTSTLSVNEVINVEL